MLRVRGVRTLALAVLVLAPARPGATNPQDSAGKAEQIGFHYVRTDAQGAILPWFSADPGASYDHVLRLVWKFWRDMKSCPNGLKYYLQHQVWAHPLEDARGIGGD